MVLRVLRLFKDAIKYRHGLVMYHVLQHPFELFLKKMEFAPLARYKNDRSLFKAISRILLICFLYMSYQELLPILIFETVWLFMEQADNGIVLIFLAANFCANGSISSAYMHSTYGMHIIAHYIGIYYEKIFKGLSIDFYDGIGLFLFASGGLVKITSHRLDVAIPVFIMDKMSERLTSGLEKTLSNESP